MLKYIGKRIISHDPSYIGIILYNFYDYESYPGDPAAMILGEGATIQDIEALREEMGG